MSSAKHSRQVYVNGRFVVHAVTGVQRYAREVVDRLGSCVRVLIPHVAGKGISGHVWEQVVLPHLVRDGLLWSPCGSGPVVVKRQVVTIHDVAPLVHPEWFNPWYAHWYRWMLTRLVNRVRAIITVSKFSKAELAERFRNAEHKIYVIPNGTTLTRSVPSQEAIRSVTARLGIDDKPYYLFVGSLEPRKNVVRLLEGWKLSKLAAHANLVLVGSTGDKRVFAQVRMQLETPGVVRVGYVSDDDLRILYTGALALIYPSLYEGFGLPVLEAMTVGTPVITSSGTAMAEVAGGAALLVDPYDTEHIADGLVRIWLDQDLRFELSRLGLERAKSFSWDDVALRTRELLVSLAESE